MTMATKAAITVVTMAMTSTAATITTTCTIHACVMHEGN